MKIVGYDGFTYSNNPIRLNEIVNTLRWNIKYFDKMFIFCKNEEDLSIYANFNLGPKAFLEIFPEGLTELSMQDLFNLINKRSQPEDLKCFLNLDTTMSDAWLNAAIDDDVFMFFTNRTTEDGSATGGVGNLSWTEGLDLFNQKGILDSTKFMNYNDPNLPSTIYGRWFFAQCGWSWKTVKPLSEKTFLGFRGAEHAFLRDVRNAGYKARSGALKYPTYHNHGSNIRTDKQLSIIDSAVDGGRLFPEEVL